MGGDEEEAREEKVELETQEDNEWFPGHVLPLNGIVGTLWLYWSISDRICAVDPVCVVLNFLTSICLFCACIGGESEASYLSFKRGAGQLLEEASVVNGHVIPY